MSDESHVVRHVSWNEVFGFSHIFKTWKMAIHPSKLFLALLAIGLTLAIGLGMDYLWTVIDNNAVVMPNETWAAFTSGQGQFKQKKDQWLAKRPKDFSPLTDKPRDEYQRSLTTAENAFKDDKSRADQLPEKDKAEALSKAVQDRDRRKQEALNDLVKSLNTVEAQRGGPILQSFLKWEDNCLWGAIRATRKLNFTGGMREVAAMRGSDTPSAYRAEGFENEPFKDPPAIPSGSGFSFDLGRVRELSTPAAPAPANQEYGLVTYLALMAWGLWWLITTHPIYSLIYIVVALAIWALLGGAICRIAAMHAAREEKPTMSAAMKFSAGKFLSFFTAPVLPLVLIAVAGMLLALGGLIGVIPYFGEWFVAVFFLLALVVGMVIAFLSVGLGGGWPLMWPTIAVEGSDSFDAMSRSFSYVYARPFRYTLYWGVAAVYGVICYLFVRLFAFITLAATHCWMGWAMRLSGREGYSDVAGKLDVMWARPTFWNFHGPMQWDVMNGSEAGASMLLAFWVYLVSGVVLAFLASFVFCASTNIYYLLRRQVDATDLDDVYVEETLEETAPAASGMAELSPPASTQGPAAEGAAEQPKPTDQTPPPEAPGDNAQYR